MGKDSLRVHFKRKLNALDQVQKVQQSAALATKIFEFLGSQQGVWTLFSPLNDEPNLTSLMDSSPHIQWVFPRVESKEVMRFYRVTSGDELVSSIWGLDEPPLDQERLVEKSELTGCLIPGLAFDRQGYRLGRGGGYYDRFLENYKGLKLGVTFNEGLTTETLPRKSHDQQMTIVISPEEWIEVDTSEVTNGI